MDPRLPAPRRALHAALAAIASVMLAALFIASSAASTLAEDQYSGSYEGKLTRYPDSLDLRSSEVTVTVDGSALEGREQLVARVDSDRGEFLKVIEEVTQWVEFSGDLGATGEFSAPGRSFTSYKIVSCEGDAAQCAQQQPAIGNATGFPVTVAGRIESGLLKAEVFWSEEPRYAFEALKKGYQPPAATSPERGAGTAPAADLQPGITVRGDSIFIVSPPGSPLEISREDLPDWARDLLVTVGATYARVGPPGTISGGDAQVLLDGFPVARVGDPSNLNGIIVEGSSRIFVNGVPAATVGSMVIDPQTSPRVGPGIGGPIVRTVCSDVAPSASYMGGKVCLDTGVAILKEAVRKGDVRVSVNDNGEFVIGDGVLIGSDESNVELAIVDGKGSLVLDRPLAFDHPVGAVVVRVPAKHAGAISDRATSGDGRLPDWRLIAVAAVALVAALVAGLALRRARHRT